MLAAVTEKRRLSTTSHGGRVGCGIPADHALDDRGGVNELVGGVAGAEPRAETGVGGTWEVAGEALWCDGEHHGDWRR